MFGGFVAPFVSVLVISDCCLTPLLPRYAVACPVVFQHVLSQFVS